MDQYCLNCSCRFRDISKKKQNLNSVHVARMYVYVCINGEQDNSLWKIAPGTIAP